jgi:DNA-directed RNA polymerase specialized sigma subunit
VPISTYGNVVRGQNPTNTVEDFTSDLLEYEDKLKSLISEYARLKKEIQGVIEGVSNMQQRTILRLRFIERLSFRDIGIAMSYSKSQIDRLYQKAIENVKIS